MALASLKIFSECLGRATGVEVIIPQRSTTGEIGVDSKRRKEKYPVLYLLHGLSDDETIWMRRTSIERYATKHGIAVVMPNGDRSFYTDIESARGLKYFKFITEELPSIICDLFPVSDKRCDTVIGGNSMGGYGALKAALRNPEKYGKVIALSSVADILAQKERFRETLAGVFGEMVNIPESEELFALSKSAAEGDMKPSIYIAVGRADYMYEDNLRLAKHLESLGYDLRYEDGAGAHSWDFWDEYIQKGLNFAFGK